jgi:hypothetical protein
LGINAIKEGEKSKQMSEERTEGYGGSRRNIYRSGAEERDQMGPVEGNKSRSRTGTTGKH